MAVTARTPDLLRAYLTRIGRYGLLAALEAKHLNEVIEQLPEQARYVLLRRYGLGDRDPAALAQLSRELDLSKERVRELQRNTECALKASSCLTKPFGAVV